MRAHTKFQVENEQDKRIKKKGRKRNICRYFPRFKFVFFYISVRPFPNNKHVRQTCRCGLDDKENWPCACASELSPFARPRFNAACLTNGFHSHWIHLRFSLIFSQKSRSVEAATGEWMNSFIRRPSRQRFSKDGVDAGDIVARGIRRSWTISSKYIVFPLCPFGRQEANEGDNHHLFLV